MILSIDFDGTISRGTYPAIDGLQPYARDVINRLYQAGHYIIINTCRSNGHLLDAINWLLHHRIPFHRVNDNHPIQSAAHQNNSRKIFADLYIDDRNIGGFPGWLQCEEMINEHTASTETNNSHAHVLPADSIFETKKCNKTGCNEPEYEWGLCFKHHCKKEHQ